MMVTGRIYSACETEQPARNGGVRIRTEQVISDKRAQPAVGNRKASHRSGTGTYEQRGRGAGLCASRSRPSRLPCLSFPPRRDLAFRLTLPRARTHKKLTKEPSNASGLIEPCVMCVNTCLDSPEAAAVHAGARRCVRPVVTAAGSGFRSAAPLPPRNGAERGVVGVGRAARQHVVQSARHAHPPRWLIPQRVAPNAARSLRLLLLLTRRRPRHRLFGRRFLLLLLLQLPELL